MLFSGSKIQQAFRHGYKRVAMYKKIGFSIDRIGNLDINKKEKKSHRGGG